MGMEAAVSPVPDDVAALKALLNAATRRADEAEARLANAKARESATEAMIAHLKLRSEEHTSELQSLMRSSYAVFCLKKKTQTTKKTYTVQCIRNSNNHYMKQH